VTRYRGGKKLKDEKMPSKRVKRGVWSTGALPQMELKGGEGLTNSKRGVGR